MKVVILCGGKGTRLREYSERLPKSLLLIGGKPLIWHIMRIYAHHGVKDFILSLGYQSWKFKEYFLHFRAMSADVTVSPGKDIVQVHDRVLESDWNVTLADTGEETMTGGRIWRVRKYLESEEEFCVTYGDGVADINITKLVAFHRQQGTVGTISVVHPMSRYGRVEITGNKAMGFQEKAYNEHEWINGGFMVFNGAKVWDFFRDDPSLVLENDPLPAMVRRHQLSVYKHDGFWMGMDTAHEYALLNDLWKTGAAPWKVW